MGHSRLQRQSQIRLEGMAGGLLAQNRKTTEPRGMESEHRSHQERSLRHDQAGGEPEDRSLCEDSTRRRAEYPARGPADCRPQCVSSWPVDVPKAYADGLRNYGRIF